MQGAAVVLVLALALPNLESSRADFERNLVALASLVLVFDAIVLVASWVPRRRSSVTSWRARNSA